ncbi:MAG: hypothetical protein AABW67_03225 [Nanoarchaeota archaeon]
MPIDISGLSFFMPVFSFLLVFLIVYAILAKTKIVGDNNFIHFLISFIIAIIFLSFSSMRLYVETITPWFVVMIVIVFFVLLVAGFSTKAWDKIMTPAFAWTVIGILILIFLIAAIKVFNPVLHPDLVITTGGNGDTSFVQQLADFFGSTKFGGSLLLIVVAIIVSWVITKK